MQSMQSIQAAQNARSQVLSHASLWTIVASFLGIKSLWTTARINRFCWQWHQSEAGIKILAKLLCKLNWNPWKACWQRMKPSAGFPSDVIEHHHAVRERVHQLITARKTIAFDNNNHTQTEISTPETESWSESMVITAMSCPLVMRDATLNTMDAITDSRYSTWKEARARLLDEAKHQPIEQWRKQYTSDWDIWHAWCCHPERQPSVMRMVLLLFRKQEASFPAIQRLFEAQYQAVCIFCETPGRWTWHKDPGDSDVRWQYSYHRRICFCYSCRDKLYLERISTAAKKFKTSAPRIRALLHLPNDFYHVWIPDLQRKLDQQRDECRQRTDTRKQDTHQRKQQQTTQSSPPSSSSSTVSSTVVSSDSVRQPPLKKQRI